MPSREEGLFRGPFHAGVARDDLYLSVYPALYILPRGELKKELIGYLRHEHPTRRRRPQRNDRRGVIPAMISIEERPAEVADRSVPGHWEGDLIMGAGNRSAIGTLVERTTRLVLIVPLTAKDAASMRRAFARAIRTLPEQLALSLTYDQGREMAEHKLFTAATPNIGRTTTREQQRQLCWVAP